MTLLISDVRLIDGLADAAREHVDVVVVGERIVTVEAHDPVRVIPPAGERLADAGRTLLPGLIDAHAHHTFDPTQGDLEVLSRRSDAEIVLRAAGHDRIADEHATGPRRGHRCSPLGNPVRVGR